MFVFLNVVFVSQMAAVLKKVSTGQGQPVRYDAHVLFWSDVCVCVCLINT